MNAVIDAICRAKIIAIVRGLAPEYMEPLAAALYAGGIRAVEVTYNQAAPDSFGQTDAAIRLIAERFHEKLLVGAGTVLTGEQVSRAADAGAKYIISPGISEEVISKTKTLGLVSMPGAMTPTEILRAVELGADIVKVFPASVLGASYISAIRAPINHVKLMAVGGITEKNAVEFLRAGCVGLGVGGNLVNKAWIEAGAFDKIEMLAREYTKAVEG